MSKLTPEQQLSWDTTIANMCSNRKYDAYLFYFHLLGQCSIEFTDRVDTAGISFQLDHYNLAINPDITTGFFQYSLEERLAILKHEMLHIINQHWTRREDSNPRRFNIAADCSINQFIEPTHLPKGVILPSTLSVKSNTPVPAKLTAEQYYQLLEDNEDEDNQQSTLDDHGEWDNSVGDKDLAKDLTSQALEKAASATAKSKGTLPAEYGDWISLLARNHEVNWKDVLRRIVGNKKAFSRSTIMRRDRRQPFAEHLKGRTKDRIYNLAVVGDESGSVSDVELSQAIVEVSNICKLTQTPIWYVPVDTQAYTPQRLTSTQRSFKRSACGGTILSPAIQQLKDSRIQANAIVVITDGYICQSDVEAYQALNIPIIWLITSEGTIPDGIIKPMRAFKLKSPKHA